MPADAIGDDMAQSMVGDFFGRQRASPYQLLYLRMVARQAVEFAATTQVTATVSHVRDEELFSQVVRERECAAHAMEFRTLGGFGENAGVHLQNGFLEIAQHLVVVCVLAAREPFQNVQDK